MKCLKILLSLSLSTMALFSCAGNKNSTPEKWQYTREDVTNFDKTTGEISLSENGVATYKVNVCFPLLTRELTADDIVLYDTDALSTNLKDSGKQYADYEVVKSSAVSFDTIETNVDNTGFTLNFDGSQAEHYSVLVSKDAIYNSTFLIVDEKAEDMEISGDDEQTQWEKKYVTSTLTWKEYSFGIDMIKNIAYILIGVAGEEVNPAAMVQGIFGLLSQIGSLSDSSPTIQDVLKKLDAMDKKIDNISKKIDYNTNQLANESIRIEADVDQARLDTLGNAITTFANEATSKVGDINRDYEDVMDNAYKNFVSSAQTVKLKLAKNSQGEWASAALMEMNESEANFNLEISSFPKCQNFLSSHNQKVSNGFMDALNSDLESAINSASLPDGLSKDSCRDYIAGMINEVLTRDYYKANPEKAQTYRNQMINYAQRISGSNGGVSIVSIYLSRLELMYNFGSEIKDDFRSIIAGLMRTLDINVARAAQACSYTDNIGVSDLPDEYKKARDMLTNTYKSVQDGMSNAYSFTTECSLSGNFFNCLYNVDYENRGNNPILKTSFGFYSYSPDIKNFVDDNINNYNPLTAIEHKRIITRWNLLRNQGLVSSDDDYVHYLSNSSVVTGSAIGAYDSLHSAKWIGTDCYRILTADRSERDLTSNDKSISFYCQSQGNLSSNYFELKQRYNYASYRDSSCWSGRIMEATFIDASTGEAHTNQRLCAWADYAESHSYWIDDEYWAFQDNEAHAYFFMVSKC